MNASTLTLAALVGFILGFGLAAVTAGRVDDKRIEAGGFERKGQLYSVEKLTR